MFGSKKPAEEQGAKGAPSSPTLDDPELSGGLPPIDQKPFMEAIWPVLACGAGLFSDGYINNVCRGCPPLRSIPIPPVGFSLVLASSLTAYHLLRLSAP